MQISSPILSIVCQKQKKKLKTVNVKFIVELTFFFFFFKFFSDAMTMKYLLPIGIQHRVQHRALYAPDPVHSFQPSSTIQVAVAAPVIKR